MFSVTNGTVKTPKSVLFPFVVKVLCNNVDVVKLINKYGNGVSYDLVEEIETLVTLDVINKQRENRVVLSVCVTQEVFKSTVALMVADNMDNLECTLSGSGTSGTRLRTTSGEKCRRSSPGTVVTKEIPE